MDIKVKYYEHELPLEAKEIRFKVFCEEQGFENEFDDIDSKAIHIVLFDNNTACATARIFTENNGKSYHVGRVAVIKEYRMHHLGKVIMDSIEQKAKELGASQLELSAQCRVTPFYEKQGFKQDGDIYYDEHCPHVYMKKDI